MCEEFYYLHVSINYCILIFCNQNYPKLGTVTCEAGNSLPYITANKATLTCESDPAGEANSGKYTCGDTCPVCERMSCKD